MYKRQAEEKLAEEKDVERIGAREHIRQEQRRICIDELQIHNDLIVGDEGCLLYTSFSLRTAIFSPTVLWKSDFTSKIRALMYLSLIHI